MAAHPEVLSYLVEGAKRRGIDPNVVIKAFGHEGLNVFDPNKPDLGGDEGSSFGPYQLHYKGMSKSMPNAGMGDDFTAKTGLNAKDPSTWKAQTDFVLDYLAGGGTWKPWMGAAAEGITGRMGLPGGSNAPAPQRPNATSPQMAADMASPGNPQIATPPTTAPQQQGPWPQPQQTPVAGVGEDLRQALAKMATSYKMPTPAMATAPAANLAPTPTQRMTRGDVAPLDPQALEAQKQQLAMAMQRLNSGKLFL